MRTTVDDVINILDNTSLDDDVIEGYINSANVFVTATLGTTLTVAVLTEIEKWIAAHMITMTRERQSKEEDAGSAKIKWSGEWGKGLLFTSYGQMAVSMDTTGALNNIAKGKSNAWIYAIPNFD
jgi:hypothetical protein